MPPLTERAPAPLTANEEPNVKKEDGPDVKELQKLNLELRTLLDQTERLTQRVNEQLEKERLRQSDSPIQTPENVFKTPPN